MWPSNSKKFRVIFSFIERGIHGDILLSRNVQRTKLNKNNFCVSRSRLDGDTENSSCEGAYIMQLSRNLLGLIQQPSEVSLRCVRKCVSYRTCDVSTNGK